jgi:murein L,D-transpeptidase YafK
MKMRSFNVPARLVVLLALAAAATRTGAHAQATERESGARAVRPALEQARTASSAGPTAWEPVQLVIYKSERTLALYRSGSFEKQYPVVLGLAATGRKRHENDARTPEGLYRVVGKRAHDRWQYFLALDYPNAADRKSYQSELLRGSIPDDDGEPFGIGHSIGIHGNDRESEQRQGVDWTKGCIALDAADIAALAAEVTVGTAVWIVE